MKLKISSDSKTFLERHLPVVLKENNLREALIQLGDLIDEKGFAPPHYDEYNDFGREAQRVYDDLYLSNIK